MIYATSELEYNALDLEEAQIVPQLEEWTGADLLVSPVHLPLTQALLIEHLRKGACLVQVKRGHDLASSVFDGRLHQSLSKMRATGARSSQAVLLFAGVLHEREGQAMINRQEIRVKGERTYWAVRTAISEWTEQGGVYDHIERESFLSRWLVNKENRLKEYLKNPTRDYYSPFSLYEVSDDPLQEVRTVTDWRKTLATFPGMGAVKIENLAAAMREAGADMSLITALVWLTDWDLARRVRGIGPGICRSVRNWLGIGDEFILNLDVYENLKVESIELEGLIREIVEEELDHAKV